MPANEYRPQDYPLPHDYSDHDWLWREGKRAGDKRREENFKREEWVAQDIERRRERIRQKQRVASEHVRSAGPDRTDMTFWLTMVGPRPRIGVTPEEERGLRTKTVGEVEHDKNGYHVRAREGYVYWPKMETLKLSNPILMANVEVAGKCGARTDRLEIRSSGTLGSFKPDWKKVRF